MNWWINSKPKLTHVIDVKQEKMQSHSLQQILFRGVALPPSSSLQALKFSAALKKTAREAIIRQRNQNHWATCLNQSGSVQSYNKQGASHCFICDNLMTRKIYLRLHKMELSIGYILWPPSFASCHRSIKRYYYVGFSSTKYYPLTDYLRLSMFSVHHSTSWFSNVFLRFDINSNTAKNTRTHFATIFREVSNASVSLVTMWTSSNVMI